MQARGRPERWQTGRTSGSSKDKRDVPSNILYPSGVDIHIY